MLEQKTPKSSSKTGWTDHELLVYVFGLIEYSNAKLDIKQAPRPNGRSIRACEQKIQGLKASLRAELKALKEGAPIAAGDGTPTPKTGRKRKADECGNMDDTPSKGRRARKVVPLETAGSEDDEESIGKGFKMQGEDEVKDEEDRVKLEVKTEDGVAKEL